MNKPFKKFYETGQNKYFVANINSDTYLGIESFIYTEKRILWFTKQKELVQGTKVLRIHPIIGILFDVIQGTKVLPNQEGIFESDLKYEGINKDIVKETIVKCFNTVLDNELKNLEEWYQDKKRQLLRETSDTIFLQKNKELTEYYKKMKDNIKSVSSTHEFDLDDEYASENPELKGLLKKDIKFLFRVPINSFSNEYIFYDYDCFGTLTLYKITETDVKKKRNVKCIETYILNRKIIIEFIESTIEGEKENE